MSLTTVKAPHCLSCLHWTGGRPFLLEEEYFFSLWSSPLHVCRAFPCFSLLLRLTNISVYNFSETAPFQSPALLNRQVKLLLSPFLLLHLFLLSRSEWRTWEVEVLASQDSNGQVGKRHGEDSRTAFRLTYTRRTRSLMPAGSTVLSWRWQMGWPEHTQFPGRGLDAHTRHPAPDQPAQPCKPSKTQWCGLCRCWGRHHK